MSALLTVENLTVAFPAREGRTDVVRGVSFAIGAGEFIGLVGESGSGKSVSAQALLGLLPSGARIVSGRVELDGIDLVGCDDRQLREVRGARIAMIFQEPMTALNPVLTIGTQIVEAVRAHRDPGPAGAKAEAIRLLELVAIPEAARRLADYPHQLSGGQRQRAMIAMALASEPDLLIADEATTALDVTIQAQILELLEGLRTELGLAVLLITHDLAVVAETCDRALVMYAGRIVEEAPIDRLFAQPAHPYTRGLLASVPGFATARIGEDLPTIPGQIPEPGALPTGCAFHPRCSDVLDVCSATDPRLRPVAVDHRAACLLYTDGT
jgi:oligopeptide/dipeptide ABC transporter ATP-binding protein